jgi:hypothetical protein
MNEEQPNGRQAPWLVGGPGRSGKTTLVHALFKANGPVAGFPVEGLFPFYLKRRFLFFPRRRRALLKEYLTRPRYMDSERDETLCPIEFYRDPLPDILDAIPNSAGQPIQLMDWALRRFAHDRGGQNWAAFDLHPEFRFPTFRRHIAGLRLAVAVRDPCQSLADMMYWRPYGEGTPRPHRRFKHSLIMWCLSLQTAQRLIRRHPGEVMLFSFDALIHGDREECEKLAAAFGLAAETVRGAFDFKPRGGALAPSGETNEPILTDSEAAEIALLCLPMAGDLVRHFAAAPADAEAARPGFLRLARGILALGRVSPRLARLAADFIYFPGNSSQRMVNSLRRMVEDNVRG